MRKNIERVVNAFLARTSHNEKNLATDGDVIRSYDMVIAQRMPDGTFEVIDRCHGPTMTTKGHIGGVALAIDLAGYAPVTVPRLSGRKPHVFRDRAGDEGYLDRLRPLRAAPARKPATMTDIRSEVVRRAFKLVK